jgi:cell division transport system permease protein
MLRSDLPPDRDAGFFLPAIAGFLVFLAALALAGSMATDNLLDRWQNEIASAFTVELPPVDGEAQAAGEIRRQAVLAAITATPGVEGATLLDDADKDRLLAPWLGGAASSLGLPLPDLIAVQTAVSAKLDLAGLGAKLQALSAGASVDDHAAWRDRIAGIARAVHLASFGLMLLTALAAGACVVFVTRAGLASHRRAIEILHLIGAHDAYIAGQFQRQTLGGALGGGILGAVAAAGIFEAARRFLPDVPPPSLALQPLQWAIVALLPVLAALLAMLTVRYTVLGALRKVL